MISPNGHYVLIKPDDVTEMDSTLKGAKEAGLHIPEEILNQEQGATVIGTLVAIGPDAWVAFKSKDPWAEVGQRVYYPRHTGNKLKDPDTGIEYLLMTDERVIANYYKENE